MFFSSSARKGIELSERFFSRAVLSNAGQPVLATEDHKPSNPIERERIQNAGGSVMIQRVNGSLAVSRALGDFEYKNVEGKGPTEQLVSPEPEFYIRERSLADDQFLVLACDGVWDVMTNEDICNFVGHRMKVHDDLEVIANEVIDTCLHKVRHRSPHEPCLITDMRVLDQDYRTLYKPVPCNQDKDGLFSRRTVIFFGV